MQTNDPSQPSPPEAGLPESEVIASGPEIISPPSAAEDAPAMVTPEVPAQPVMAAAETPTGPAAPNPDEAASFRLPPYDGPNNAEQIKETYLPLDAPWDYNNITLVLPSDTSARTQEMINNTPDVDLAATEEGAIWAYNVQQGLKTGMHLDFGAGAARRPDATWRQTVETPDGISLNINQPRLGVIDGPLIKGEKAMIRVRAALGRGSLVQIPLWHSGFWLTIRMPEESRLLELYQRIAEDKIQLGRETHGLAFANHSVFMAGHIMDMALEHHYENTVKDLNDMQEVRSLIQSPDLAAIAWGMACAVWPRGFQYSRAVLNAAGEETRVIHEKLNLAYLQWTDTASLTEWQIKHMSRRSQSSCTRADLENYRNQFTRGQATKYPLNDKINLTLAVPTVKDYLESGERWVNNIVHMIDTTFTKLSGPNERNKYITDHGKATAMRQYSHWIKEIELPSIGKRIVDKETIAMFCDSISSDDNDRNEFFNVVNKFINESTISIIATPIVDDLERNRTIPRLPWLLPMDAVSTFFILHDQKALQILRRP